MILDGFFHGVIWFKWKINMSYTPFTLSGKSYFRAGNFGQAPHRHPHGAYPYQAHRDPDLRLSTRVAGVIFALVTCSFAARAVLVFPEIGAAIPNEQILLSKNAQLGTTVNCMLWTFGAVSLVQQRQAAIIARLHRKALAMEGEKRVAEHQLRLSRDRHLPGIPHSTATRLPASHVLILQGELEVAFCGEAEGAEAAFVES